MSSILIGTHLWSNSVVSISASRSPEGGFYEYSEGRNMKRIGAGLYKGEVNGHHWEVFNILPGMWCATTGRTIATMVNLYAGTKREVIALASQYEEKNAHKTP